MAAKGIEEMTAEERQHEAVRDELRARVLRLLIVGGPSHPAGMAKTLGASLDDVNYHTKRLVALGCAEFIGVQPVKGNIVGRVYGAIERPEGVGCDCLGSRALDSLAQRLAATEGSPYAVLAEVVGVIRSTGRPVVLPGESPTPEPVNA